jgi:hypothetical protein
MALSTWWQDVEIAVITVLAADADLAALGGKIEQSITDPFSDQELMGNDFPYIGVVAIGHGADESDIIGVGVHSVDILINVGAVGTPRLTTQRTVQQILAQIALVTCQERRGNRFSLSNATGNIVDCRSGGSTLNPSRSSDETAAFLESGSITLSVEYELLAG